MDIRSRTEREKYVDRYDYWQKHKDEFNSLFIGTSRTWRGLNNLEFDKKTALKTYNFGGMLAGPMRGGYAKGGEWAGSLSQELGGGTLAKAVGYPFGAWAGSIVGGVIGIGKGVANGVVYGMRDPFSDENLSVDGSSFGDFNPFDFNY